MKLKTIKTHVKAGAVTTNHSPKRLAIRSNVRAGALLSNHNAKALS